MVLFCLSLIGQSVCVLSDWSVGVLLGLMLASLYVPFKMANSISCIFFRLSSPSAWNTQHILILHCSTEICAYIYVLYMYICIYVCQQRSEVMWLTAGTSSLLTSSTARFSLISARFWESSTVMRTWRSSFRCSQLGFPRFCSSCTDRQTDRQADR